MSPTRPKFIVEGDTDRRFFVAVARFRLNSDLNEAEDFIHVKSDWKSLHKFRTEIERTRDLGRPILCVLDADWDTNRHPHGGFKKRLSAVHQSLNDMEVSAHIWLWPNHQDDGDLEMLLARIGNANHAEVFECFECYLNCLRKAGSGKGLEYGLPGSKARIFAYLEAIGASPNKPDFGDSNAWDLRSPNLDRLTNFLAQHLRQTTPEPMQ